MNNDANPFYDKKELYFTRILDYFFEYVSDNDSQIKLYDTFDELRRFCNNNIFVEKAIRAYTGESSFCYLFNRAMRNFSKGLMLMAYFMGPFLFGLNK